MYVERCVVSVTTDPDILVLYDKQIWHNIIMPNYVFVAACLTWKTWKMSSCEIRYAGC